MIYILFLLQVSGDVFSAQPVQTFDNMDDCFAARNVLVQQIGRPIVNYQAICVAQNNQESDTL